MLGFVDASRRCGRSTVVVDLSLYVSRSKLEFRVSSFLGGASSRCQVRGAKFET